MLDVVFKDLDLTGMRVASLSLMTTGFSLEKCELIGISVGTWHIGEETEPEIATVFFSPKHPIPPQKPGRQSIWTINRITEKDLRRQAVPWGEGIDNLRGFLQEGEPEFIVAGGWDNFTRPWLEQHGLYDALIWLNVLDLCKLEPWLAENRVPPGFALMEDFVRDVSSVDGKAVSINKLADSYLGSTSTASPLSEARVRDLLDIYNTMLKHK